MYTTRSTTHPPPTIGITKNLGPTHPNITNVIYMSVKRSLGSASVCPRLLGVNTLLDQTGSTHMSKAFYLARKQAPVPQSLLSAVTAIK